MNSGPFHHHANPSPHASRPAPSFSTHFHSLLISSFLLCVNTGHAIRSFAARYSSYCCALCPAEVRPIFTCVALTFEGRFVVAARIKTLHQSFVLWCLRLPPFSCLSFPSNLPVS
jgi:hypothetical protein